MSKALLLASLLASLAAVASSGCHASPAKAATSLDFPSGGYCSGTYVSKHVVLTAAHCFWRSHTVSVAGGPMEPARIVKDDGKDHVLLCALKPAESVVGLANYPVRKQGKKVRMWGYTGRVNLGYREGYTAGSAFVDDGFYQSINYLLILPSYGGDSGSGIFVGNKLVGVLTGGHYIYSRLLPLEITKQDIKAAEKECTHDR